MRRAGLQGGDPGQLLGRTGDLQHLDLAAGQGAGLVEVDEPRLGESLEHLAPLDHDAEARGATHARDDRQRRGQAQGAGTGDDQEGDRVLDRRARIHRPPQGQGQKGEHDQRHGEVARHAIGEAHHRRRPARGELDHLEQAAEACGLAHGLDLDHHARGEVDRTGVHGLAGGDLDRTRLAGQERQVEGARAAAQDPVRRHRVPRAQLDEVAGVERRDRHLADDVGLVRVQATSPGRGHRVQELEAVPGRALLPTLDEAAEQQEEDQEGDRLEVHLAAIGPGVVRAAEDAGHQPERDRQVHVRRARPEGREGAAQEGATGPQHGDRGQHERVVAQEEAHVRGHAREDPAVQREGDQHRVQGQHGRHPEPDQLGALLPPAQVAGATAAGRVRRIAQAVEGARDLGQRDRTRLPLDLEHRATEVQPRAAHAAQQGRQLLHQPDAGGAVHALEVQLARAR
ncbi:MAG: hypothetical protein P1V81_05565 [Planctomycetota bacterium]|nr:hypothetical protein [Planctomycetota bacterium]